MSSWGRGGLRPFLQRLESHGRLVHIQTPVSPVLEIPTILERVLQSHGPALLFESVEGSEFPVLANMFGGRENIRIALGREPQEIGAQLVQAYERLKNPTVAGLWQSRHAGLRILRMRPRRVRSGPVMEVCTTPDLHRLPVLRCWPGDADRFITLGNTMSRHPVSGDRNLGLYRLQCQGTAQTGMHWQIHRGGGFHFWQAERMNRDLPITVTLGGSAALMFSAAAPLPEGMDELMMAGLIDGAGIPIIKQPSDGFLPDIIADAEFVLTGYVPAHVRQLEGPFGDHFGHYSNAAEYPVFRIEKIFHRKSPIYPATVVGKPLHEDWWWGCALQEVMVPLMKIIKPEIVDYWAYPETGFHGLGVLAAVQRYQKEGIRSALGILGEGQASLTKCIMVVDPDCPVRSFNSLVERLHRNFDPLENLIIIPGTSYDTLDFTSRTMNLGSKMIMDLSHHGAPVQRTALDWQRLENRLTEQGLHWHVWGESFVSISVPASRTGKNLAEQLSTEPALNGASLVVLVSEDVRLTDPVQLLWGWFTRFEPARDLYFRSRSFIDAVPRYEGPVVIDATWKDGYPEPLRLDPDMEHKVAMQWKTYGIPD